MFLQTSDRKTSDETANFCLMMFAGIVVDILISDIDITHRVQTKKLGFSGILQLCVMFDYGCTWLSNWSQIVSFQTSLCWSTVVYSIT